MINEKILQKLSQIKKKDIPKSNYDICLKHQKYLYKICITCKTDICPQCEKEHINHYMITQEEIMPDPEEIKTLQFAIKNYVIDSTGIIDEILNWQKEINDKILLFEKNMKNNIILNSQNFIYNFSFYNPSLFSTTKFRKIYSWIIEPEPKNKNNKILSFLNEDNFINRQYNNIFETNNFGLNYKYNDYLDMKHLLKDINNYKDNFIIKSQKILDFLVKALNNNNNTFNTRYIRSNNNNRSNSLNFNRNFNYGVVNKENIYRLINQDILNNIKNKKRNQIKGRNIQQNINKINIGNNLSRTLDNKNIFRKFNLSYTPKNNNNINYLRNTIINGSMNDAIYLKKRHNTKISSNLKKLQIDINNLNSERERNNSSKIANSKRVIFKASTYSNFTINTPNNNNKINYLDSMSDIENIKKINRNIKGKKYVHKKFILNNEKKNNLNNRIIYNNKLDRNNIKTFVQIENSIDTNPNDTKKNILNSPNPKLSNNRSSSNNSKNHSYSSSKKNNIINIPISFSSNSNPIYNNMNENVKTSLFNKFMNTDNSTNKTYPQNNDNNFNNNDFNIKIIKPFKYEFFKVNNERKIYLGLDLGNINTKIGIIKNYNEIQLMCFSDNNYSIPTMISFNHNEICIGSKSELLMINNPSQTIFNIIKIFGHEYDEIISSNSHYLWPFKLYRDNYNKPYVKIKINEKIDNKEKIYYFEDILILFLKKVFDLLFQKITLENINNEENKQPKLNLNLVVAIPNCFTYYQRKLLEKIFYTEIFPNNCIYGGYQIQLDNVGIENRSSIGCLCLKNSPKISTNNILIIDLDTCSVDISMVSIHENINQVISSENIELLHENFIDNFINLCLSLLKKNNINIPKEFLYSGSLLSKIRKLSPNIIKNLTFNEESIFIIDNLNNGNGNCVIKVNRVDYEKECFELCKKILILIKKVLKRAKVNENDINDIILVGEEINMNKLNQMIKELFINNKNIYDKLPDPQNLNFNDENKDFYIVAGAALRAYNINNQLSFYIFNNISPFNIGVESYDGNLDILIEKNAFLPLSINKMIKIKNNNNDNNIIINIYEGENIIAKSNKFISQFTFNKKEFKFLKQIEKKEFLELFIEFEIDSYLNIKFYINDDKTYKHLIKLEINIKKVD